MVWSLSKLIRNTDVIESNLYLPTVSFIIAAYNEEKVIREKIVNTLSLDYPKELFQIIIVSDGSDDNTAKIVSEYEESGIIGLHENNSFL